MATRSEEIEREIEDTRRGMSRTAAEIERRLRAENIMDSAVSWLRNNPRGRALTDDVMDAVARNPLPVVLIGIGVLWLAWELGGRRPAGQLDRYTPMRRRMGPDRSASRHHVHVEDDGMAARPGRSPDPDELLGRVPGGRPARDAAEAFREAGRDTTAGRFDRAGTTGGAEGSGAAATGLGDYVDKGPGRRTEDQGIRERVAVYETDTGRKLEEHDLDDTSRAGGRRS